MSTLYNRIKAFEKLGILFSNKFTENSSNKSEHWSSKLDKAIDLAYKYNTWFTKDSVKKALNEWSKQLNYNSLKNWTDQYKIEDKSEKKIAIRTGLCSIKNVGNKALNSIIEERDRTGLFKDLLGFASSINEGLLGKSHYEHLATAGAFSSICSNRKKAFMSAQILVDISVSSSVDKFSQQQSIFGNTIDLSEIWKLPEVSDWDVEYK